MSYTFQIVIAGTTLLGVSCGVLGVFLFHQRQALLSDALSHATLPGIGIAYLVLVAFGLPERSFLALMIGALISTAACVILYRLLKRVRVIHSDAILAILLSSFFGFGIALLGVIQKQPRGHAAGLGQYIYGDTASMLQSDVLIIVAAAIVTIAVVGLYFKEIVATTFDREYARSIGIRTGVIEGLLLGLSLLITVVGLQAVGLILMIALFIIPALAARYWTARITGHLMLAALFAMLSAASGTITSSLWIKLPTGAAIVLSAGALFAISIVCGSRNGLLALFLVRRAVKREFNLIQLLIVLRFRLDIAATIAASDRVKYLELHGGFTAHWIADHLQIDRAALRQTIHLALRRRLLTVRDRHSYALTTNGFDRLRDALYSHELIHTSMRLFPAKTVYLRETSEVSASGLFSPEELEKLLADIGMRHPYLIPSPTSPTETHQPQ